MCNSPTVNHADVVNWFIKMKKLGFKIKQVGHDRKFCREYFVPSTTQIYAEQNIDNIKHEYKQHFIQ